MRKYLLLFAMLVVCLGSSVAQTQPNIGAQILAEHPVSWLNFNDAGPNFTDQVTGATWTPGSTTPVYTDVPTANHVWHLNGGQNDSGTDTQDDLTLATGDLYYAYSGGNVVGDMTSFRGSGMYMQAHNGTTANLVAGQPFSMSAWMSLNSWHTGLFQCIITFQGNSQYNFCINPGGGIWFDLFGTSGHLIVQSTAAIDSGIHQVAVTNDGSDTVAGTKLYIDGVSVGIDAVSDTFASTGSSVIAASAPLTVGGQPSPGANAYWVQGGVGDIRVWTGTHLSDTQVSHLSAMGWDGPYQVEYRVPGFDPDWKGNTSARITGTQIISPSNAIPFDATHDYAIYVHINHLPRQGGIIAGRDNGWILYYTGTAFCFHSRAGFTGNPVGEGVEGVCTTEYLPPGVSYDIVANYSQSDGDGNYRNDYHIYVNGQPTSGSNFFVDWEYAWWALGAGGDYTRIGGCCLGTYGGLDHMEIDEFAYFNHTLDMTFVESIFAHTKFYVNLLRSKPANPPAMIVEEDGCTDPDNIAALNLAIKAHKLGYIKLRAVINTDVMPNAAIFYRQILDSNGLAHIPLLVPDEWAGEYPPTADGWPFVSNPTFLVGGGMCSAVQQGPWLPTDWEDAYNKSTPRAYPSATQGLRKIVAGLPDGEKIAIMSGGASRPIADFMKSPADSISSETGAQMWNDHILYMAFQGTGNLDQQVDDSNYVLQHTGAVPSYLYDNGDFHYCCTPDITGPGYGETRLAGDPLRLAMLAGWTGDTRDGWDSLPTVNFLTDAFRGTCTNETVTLGAGYTVTIDPTPSNVWACPLTPAAGNSSATHGNSEFNWFVNSLANSIAQGKPRGVSN